MKILIVEDNSERIKVFEWMFSDHEITVTDDANYAKNLINEIKYDCILLDHDLGGIEVGYMLPDELNTGYNVSKSIPYSINHSTYCIVHSWNPYSSVIMFNYLKENNINVDKKLFGTFSSEVLNNV